MVVRLSADAEVGGGKLAAAAQSELLEDVREVHLDRRFADREPLGNFLVPEPERRVLVDFPLASTQTREQIRLADALLARAVRSHPHQRTSDDVARRPHA